MVRRNGPECATHNASSYRERDQLDQAQAVGEVDEKLERLDIEGKLDGTRDRLHDDYRDLREHARGLSKELREDMRNDFDSLLDNLRDDFKREIRSLRQEIEDAGDEDEG